jgi:hypothetical protein
MRSEFVLMKKIPILSFLLILMLAGEFYSQQALKASLLVAACASETKKCEPQTVKRLNFEGGKMVSSENLLVFNANSTRFERINYQFLQNRYVVSRIGDIFDIQTKEMFGDVRGDFFGAEENQIYIFKNKGGTDVKLYSFDLKARRYDAVKLQNVFFLIGVPSPSMLRSVQYNSDFNSLEIHNRYKTSSNDLDVSIDGRYQAKCGKKCADSGKGLPVLWLDDNRLLTQRKNGELVLISLNKIISVNTIVKIPVKEELESLPRLYKDFAGNVHYVAGKNYLIDIENGKYTETQTTDIGNGFEASTASSEKTFTFGGRQIGKFTTAFYKTTKNYLAVEVGAENESYYFPKQIKIWNAETLEWTTLDVNYFPKIIGWIE